MIKKIRFASCVALVVLLTVSIGAFAEASVNINVSKIDSANFPEMSLEFSTWDGNGIPLTGLTTNEVSVQEDDGAEFSPISLSTNTAADLSVALVLDVSGSMVGQPLLDVKSGAARFLDKLGKADQAAVIAFSDEVNLDPASLDPERETAFSSNLDDAYSLVENLQAGGKTELYNAVEKAVKLTSQLPPGHRAVLVFTDGRNEPADVGDPESPINLAKEANIPVFVIALGQDIDAPYLQRLATETGAYYSFTPISSELVKVFNDMAGLLKTVYVMKYSSAITDGQAGHILQLRIGSSTGEGTYEITLPDLPEIKPTPTEVQPTSTVVVPIPTIAPPPPPEVEEPLMSLKNKILLALGVLLILVGVWRFTRPKKVKVVEKCGNCGVELKENGPCPICGSTKRMKVTDKDNS